MAPRRYRPGMSVAKGLVSSVVVLAFLGVVLAAAGLGVVAVAFLGGVVHTMSGG